MAETGLCPGCMRELERIASETPEQKTGGQKMSAPGRHSQKGQQADTACCPYCGFCPSEYQQNPRCLPPDTILAGKYLVGKVLGEGGFGITYIGFDLNMKTRVAIKEYFPVELVTRDTTRRTTDGVSGSDNSRIIGCTASGSSGTTGEGAPSSGIFSSGGGSDWVISLSGEKSKTYQQGLKKYVDEARNVSQFSNIPGIVSVKDFFYENDTAYIVMEYIEGISLKEYLKQKGGKVSEEEALAVMRPVLEALEKVHAAGIVHRDISPDNIMLTFIRTGTVQDGINDPASALYGNIAAVHLIDFGAARMTAKNDQKSLTIILKHGYAPEEQYRSHGEQGPWTDVYALCAVLYRMLTGKVPEPAMDRLFSDGLKRPEELGVAVSPAVSEAVMKGLAVKKEGRIQSMSELMDALYGGKSLKKSERKLRRGMFRIFIAAGAAACVFLVIAGTVLVKMTGEGQKNREAAAEASENAGTTENLAETFGRAEDGQWEEAAADEVVLTLDEMEEELGEQIVFYEPQKCIAFSPGYEDVSRLALFCRPDGTVSATGSNQSGQCNVEDWTHVAAVSAGKDCAFGLRTDGTVLFSGEEYDGMGEASQWTGIIQLCAGRWAALGLTREGTVKVAGNGGDALRIAEETDGWNSIKAIALYDATAVGLREDGTVLFAGMKPECAPISGWEGVKEIETDGRLLVGICENGDIKAVPLMKDDDGYLQERAKELGAVSDIAQIYAGRYGDAIGVKKDGTVYCSSDFPEELRTDLEKWEDMYAVANRMGNLNEIYGIKKDGSVVTTGLPGGNAEITDMKNLEWIQVVGGERANEINAVAAYTRDGRTLISGMENDVTNRAVSSLIMAQYFLEQGGIPAQFVRDSLLLADGRLVMDGRILAEDVVYAEELWNVPIYDSLAYLLLKRDGTVDIYREGEYYEWMYESAEKVKEWKDMIQIAVTGEFASDNYEFYGLKKDGTVWHVFQMKDGSGNEMIPTDKGITSICAGYGGDVLGLNKEGEVEILEKESEETGMLQIESWKDITQLAMGECHTIGLRADGTVVAAGQNYAGQCDVEDWKDIVYIAAGRTCTLGITADGDLKMAGSLY